jgi:hypothetical protein
MYCISLVLKRNIALTCVFTGWRIIKNHQYSTRQASQLRIPLSRTNVASRFIKKTGVSLWNKHSPQASHLAKIGIFKKNLIEILIAPYSDDWQAPGRVGWQIWLQMAPQQLLVPSTLTINYWPLPTCVASLLLGLLAVIHRQWSHYLLGIGEISYLNSLFSASIPLGLPSTPPTSFVRVPIHVTPRHIVKATSLSEFNLGKHSHSPSNPAHSTFTVNRPDCAFTPCQDS